MSTDNLTKEQLHQNLLSALDDAVIDYSDASQKPLEITLAHPLPPKVRVYMYNVTSPKGDRPNDEYKSQLIAPGQDSDERGSFNFSDDWFVLLIGYEQNEDVFVLWDGYLHPDFSFSKTVYVKQRAIRKAVRGELGEQIRNLQTGEEVVITANSENLADAIRLRTSLSSSSLPEGIEAGGVSNPDPERKASDYEIPDERTSETTRKIRNTAIVNNLKQRYNYRCQICGERRKQSKDDYYAEGHHLKPLSDGGPDDVRNIIILCPNHHVDFDFGMVKVDPDSLEINHYYEDEEKEIKFQPGHDIDNKFLEYNNNHLAEF